MSRNSLIILVLVAMLGQAAFSQAEQVRDAVILKKLMNYSKFNESGDWRITEELTRDLKKALLSRGFNVSDYQGERNTDGKLVIEGKVSDFSVMQQEYDSMPLLNYKLYKANLKIELSLLGPATGWATEVRSEYEETSKKLRSFLPGPDESELANDEIADFETRGQVKWGSPEFRKSVAGTVDEKVVNDLAAQITTIIKSRPIK
jgi:hypothetical protein